MNVYNDQGVKLSYVIPLAYRTPLLLELYCFVLRTEALFGQMVLTKRKRSCH